MTNVEKLYALERKVAAYSHAMGILEYDGETTAPKGTGKNRGMTLEILGEEYYKLNTSEETMALLKELNEIKDTLDEKTRRIVELRMEEMEEISKIPMDEYLAFQLLTNEAQDVWHNAKANNDYASFAPYIDKLVSTLKKFAAYVRPDLTAYNYMLNRFEKGLTTEKCDAFFGPLLETLKPIIQHVISAKPVDETLLNVHFPIADQRILSDKLMDILKMDRNHVGIGETEHPFTTSFSRYDVRITTHYYENAFASSMYSVIHEAGHGLYDGNTAEELAYTSAGSASTMAVHESQSRFYENVIGRSRAFVKIIAPEIRKLCPALKDYTDEEMYRAFNVSKPSLIRTEADELTYSMHVVIRYEIEKKLFAGEIAAKDLPEIWNRLYKEYLGVDVPSDTEGVLQDSHWSGGGFGYFPSYALGSAYAAQLFETMKKDFDVEKEIEEGNLEKINAWLREKIWKFGCMKEPGDLMKDAFGEFDPKYYTEYLKNKYMEIYK